MSRIKDRTGEEKIMNNGTICKIVKYNNAKSIVVEFQDDFKHIVECEYGNFKKGSISNPYAKTVYGVGFIGIGEHYVFSKEKGGHNKIYKIWSRMMERCYSDKFKESNQCYNDCYVNVEWHNFQSFANWCSEHYMDGYELDKDLLVPGNREYSKEKCCMIPKWLNCFMTNCSYGNELGAVGVSVDKRNGKYKAYCSVFLKNVSKYLGTFDTIQDAEDEYKKERRKNVELAKKKAKEEGINEEIISKIS